MNTKKQYVQALVNYNAFIKGNYYSVVQDTICRDVWFFPDAEKGHDWLASKRHFSEVVSEIPTVPKQKLENVFIRVNGEAEKEAAVDLLKSMGYYNFSDYNYDKCVLFQAYSDGSFGGFTDDDMIREAKELKVDKKVVFTLAKEKTYNVDGKELTRVEVEGMIQDMDIKMNCLRNILGE